jgi:hypothetical protein
MGLQPGLPTDVALNVCDGVAQPEARQCTRGPPRLLSDNERFVERACTEIRTRITRSDRPFNLVAQVAYLRTRCES